jgi:hypothetical protein
MFNIYIGKSVSQLVINNKIKKAIYGIHSIEKGLGGNN